MTTTPTAPVPARRRRAAAPGSPRMLLLHGLGGRAAAWDGFVTHSRTTHEVWDVELPWNGLAEPGWTQRHDSHRVVVDLVGGVGCGATRQPFDVVVAHSYAAGLLLAALAAGEVHPGAAVVLVSPFYRADAGSFDWSTISYYLNDFHLVFAEALRVGPASRFSEAHRDWLGRRLRDRVGPYGWMSFFELYLRTPQLDLDAVRTPVLVLRGDADIASLAQDSRQLTGALPNARFAELRGCGHFPMIEEPERFSELVADFLDTVGPVAARPRDHRPNWS